MGQRGPIPKRSDEQAGHRTKAERPDRVKSAGSVRVPAANRGWAPEALSWYRSLRSSGQARFFEPSDWAYAQILARLLSDELKQPRRSSAMVTTVIAAMANLGTTEAARRRMRIEVHRKLESDKGTSKVAVLDRYRELAGG